MLRFLLALLNTLAVTVSVSEVLSLTPSTNLDTDYVDYMPYHLIASE